MESTSICKTGGLCLFPDVTKETNNLGNGVISHIYTSKEPVSFRSQIKITPGSWNEDLRTKDGREMASLVPLDPDIMIKASLGGEILVILGLSKSGIDINLSQSLQTKRVWFRGEGRTDFFLWKKQSRVLESQGS